MKLPSATEIRLAYDRIKKEGVCSDLLQGTEPGLYFKTENRLPGNSYKIRGVLEFFFKSKVFGQSIKVLSAGNLALATAIESSKRGVHCQAIVPEGVSEAKKSLLEYYGSDIEELPFDEIWKLVNQSPESLGAKHLHPLNPSLLCGYATLLVELQQQMKKCDAIVVPYGLGGLTLALAHGCKALEFNPRIYAVEIEGHSPFLFSLKAGSPQVSPKLRSFIEAMGAPGVLPGVFEQLKSFEIETISVTEAETRSAIRNLYQSQSMRVEGAAGAAYAASKRLTDLGEQRIVAVLTGSNISDSAFASIVSERV